MEVHGTGGNVNEALLQQLQPSGGTIGLNNLGNTCFMNSALQCILHIPELNYYFLSNYYKKEINLQNPLGNNGKISEVFAKLVHELFAARTNKIDKFSPREFKYTIGKFNSIFAGYHQQDSQEFLSYVLDGLHEDLNRIINKPYTEKPELRDTKNVNLNDVAELAAKSWEVHKLRNDSIINDLFVGLYKSTLICPICNKISITFDPYNELTLPLPTNKTWNHNIILFDECGYPKKFEVELNKCSTFNDLKSYVSGHLNIPINELICMEVFNSQFYKNYESKDSDINYMPIGDLIGDNDYIIFYHIRHKPGDLIVPVLNTLSNSTPNLKNKPFGIPFFITLSEEERYSFGSIREKLEKRYDQLSTYSYFSRIRTHQKKDYHTLNDFPYLEQKFGEYYRKTNGSIDEEDDMIEGYQSDISLANPDIPGNYAFEIKTFDSSREIKKKYPGYFSIQNENNIGTEDDEDDELWVPQSYNNFENLPRLLDRLSDKKKEFYTYNHEEEEEEENQKEQQYQPQPQQEQEQEQEQKQEQEQEAKTHQKEKRDSVADDTLQTIEISSSSSEDDFPGLNKALKEIDDSENGDTKMDILPLLCDNAGLNGNDTVNSAEMQGNQQQVPGKALISEKMAIVCEWDSDSFDIFFTGLEEDDEGGKETWSNPEVIPNEELVLKRQQQEEEQAANNFKSKKKAITLDDCLKLFEEPEVLTDQDLWYCPSCKKHTQATKALELWSLPDILTIHLKRFENQRSLSDKIDDLVEFPITALDMSPYIVSQNGRTEEQPIYDLFAVDNHYGGIGGGHYTAFVKNFVDDQWYYYADSVVHKADPKESVKGSAYLLFYRRRTSNGRYLGGDYINEIIRDTKLKQEEELKADFERVTRLKEELALSEAREKKNNESQKQQETGVVVEEEEEEEDNSQEVHLGDTEMSDTGDVFGDPSNAPANASLVKVSSVPPLRKKRKSNGNKPLSSPTDSSSSASSNIAPSMAASTSNSNGVNLPMQNSQLLSLDQSLITNITNHIESNSNNNNAISTDNSNIGSPINSNDVIGSDVETSSVYSSSIVPREELFDGSRLNSPKLPPVIPAGTNKYVSSGLVDVSISISNDDDQQNEGNDEHVGDE